MKLNIQKFAPEIATECIVSVVWPDGDTGYRQGLNVRHSNGLNIYIYDKDGTYKWVNLRDTNNYTQSVTEGVYDIDYVSMNDYYSAYDVDSWTIDSSFSSLVIKLKKKTFADKIRQDNTLSADSVDFSAVCPTPLSKIDATISANDATYPFAYDNSTKTYTSSNQNVGNSTPSISLKLNSNYDQVFLNYNVDSESAYYDYGQIYVNDSLIATKLGGSRVSGTVDLGAITTSDVIKVIYQKDGSADGGTDTFSFSLGVKDGVAQTDGFYSYTTNKGTVYYFRGAVSNNYVSFAGKYWRIIRINEDDSVTVVYEGTSTSGAGDSKDIATCSFNKDGYPYYSGIKYTEGQAKGNETDSTILEQLNTWYETNLANYSPSLHKNYIFNVDRALSSGDGLSNYSNTYYQGSYRATSYQPNINSVTDINDMFTCQFASVGNKALKYPIGLLSVDDLMYAGHVYNKDNTNTFLYTGQNYWTLTPANYLYKNEEASVFILNNNGSIEYQGVSVAADVRPVITLNPDILYDYGTGTSTSYYRLRSYTYENRGSINLGTDKLVTIGREEVPYRGSSPITPTGWTISREKENAVDPSKLYFIFPPDTSLIRKLKVNVTYDSTYFASVGDIEVHINTSSGEYTVLAEKEKDYIVDVELYRDGILEDYMGGYGITANFTTTSNLTDTMSTKVSSTLYVFGQCSEEVHQDKFWWTPSYANMQNVPISSGNSTGCIQGYWYEEGDDFALGILKDEPYSYLRLDLFFYIVNNSGSACLTGDTLIATPNGAIAINELKVGDIVYDVNNKETEIIKYYGHNTDKIYTLELENKNKVQCSYDHQFVTIDNTIITAQDCKEGALILCDNSLVKIVNIEISEGTITPVFEILTETGTYQLDNGIVCQSEKI